MSFEGTQALVVDRLAVPPRLSDADFRSWVQGRRVFFSSCMDEEMNPVRRTVQARLHELGAIPVMWEELTPADRHPERAYLEGVDRSDLFVLAVGTRYGIPDETGYSPTNKEFNRARELGLPRYVFKLNVASSSRRVGPLNDWLNGLYREISAGTFEDPEHLVGSLEDRLQVAAGEAATQWIRIGSIVFPGRVSVRRMSGQRSLSITAKTRDSEVRAAIERVVSTPWNNWSGGVSWVGGIFRGTLADYELNETNILETEIHLELTEASHQSWPQAPGNGLGGVSVQGPHGLITPAQQIGYWFDEYVLGITPQKFVRSANVDMFFPSAPSVRNLLADNQIEGWAAVGVAQTYLSEILRGWFNCEITSMEVGPAVSGGIPYRVRCRVGSSLQEELHLTGFMDYRSPTN